MSETTIPALQYEKDLVGMKYRILISSRHDPIINELARMSGVSKQVMRSALIHRADMMLLEAIPPRYNGYLAQTKMVNNKDKDQNAKAMYIFSHIIPILTEEEQLSNYSLPEILEKMEGAV